MFGTEATKLHKTHAVSGSVIAAHAVDSRTLEEYVYEAIKSRADGATQDDILAMFPDRLYPSITARFSALLRKKLVVDTGLTRTGNSGRPQRVLKAVESNLNERIV